MSEEWVLNLPDDVSERLAEMDEDRVSQVVSNALREALDLQESVQTKQDELREKMGLASQDAEELADKPEAEKKREELRERITESR